MKNVGVYECKVVDTLFILGLFFLLSQLYVANFLSKTNYKVDIFMLNCAARSLTVCWNKDKSFLSNFISSIHFLLPPLNFSPFFETTLLTMKYCIATWYSCTQQSLIKCIFSLDIQRDEPEYCPPFVHFQFSSHFSVRIEQTKLLL